MARAQRAVGLNGNDHPGVIYDGGGARAPYTARPLTAHLCHAERAARQNPATGQPMIPQRGSESLSRSGRQVTPRTGSILA